MVQKRSVKAPGGAEVRRSTNRLTCEVADQGQKRPISTAMRNTEPKRGQAEEGTRVTVGHHGFCKSTITRRQYPPPGALYRGAISRFL
ncbi:hypothetical protein PENSUB_6522 [Penicillium subrubescens]|uniref:Uncharacterized protein n=1 Tax=Penicillium subrubescens TaxID=1316194 RepID=A0A1Q5U0V5_9EURO|nr:hypothetical protein PENSUB_6522 [Penicillium subrubescens]